MLQSSLFNAKAKERLNVMAIIVFESLTKLAAKIFKRKSRPGDKAHDW